MTATVSKETTITTGPERIGKVTPKDHPVEEEKAAKSQTMAYVIYFLFGVIEALLLFRLIFKLTGANPMSSFVSFIYTLTQLCVEPFIGIFPQATTQGVTTTAVLEPATLVAIVVYAILAWGTTQIVLILSRRQQ